MDELALYLLENNITDSKRLKNEYAYRMIEAESDGNLKFVFSVMIQVMASTGFRIGDVLSLKVKDVNFENGLIKIMPAKESKCSIAQTMASFLESVKAERKEYYFNINDYHSYVMVDRSSISEVRESLTTEELQLLGRKMSELNSGEISRFIPPCLLRKVKKISKFQNDFLFRRELTGSNRCGQTKGSPISRQSAWKQISKLKAYQDGVTGNPFLLREPLIF